MGIVNYTVCSLTACVVLHCILLYGIIHRRRAIILLCYAFVSHLINTLKGMYLEGESIFPIMLLVPVFFFFHAADLRKLLNHS